MDTLFYIQNRSKIYFIPRRIKITFKDPTHTRTPFSINGIPQKKEGGSPFGKPPEKEKRVTSMADCVVSLVLIIHHSLTYVNTYNIIGIEEKLWQKRLTKNYGQT